MAIKNNEVKSGLMNKQTVHRPKMTKEDLKKQIERDRSRDAEMVTGIFRFLETPRGTLTFSYHVYPNDPYDFYELTDEERYTLPRGVARHLNNNCSFKEYQQLAGELGRQDIKMGSNADGRLKTNNMMASRKVHRTAFYPLDFTDDDLDLRTVDIAEVSIRI